MRSRRFPPPWSVEETDACFIVRDARTGRRSPMSISRISRGGARPPTCFIRDTNCEALAYAYFEDEPGRRAAAHLPTLG